LGLGSSSSFILEPDTVAVTYYTHSAYSRPGNYRYGIRCFTNADPDQLPIVEFAIILPTDTGLISGDYSVADMNLELSSVRMSRDAYDLSHKGKTYAFADAEAQIEDNGDGTFFFSFTLTDSLGNQYLGSVISPVVIEQCADGPVIDIDDDDDDDEDYSIYDLRYEPTTRDTIDRVLSDAEVDTQYFSQHGIIVLTMYNVVGGDTTEVGTFYVYADHVDQYMGLPEGTYNINRTETVGSVRASEGLQIDYATYQYYLSASYYAMVDSFGYVDTVYYLMKGTMQISLTDDGKMSVLLAARSAKGSLIRIACTQANTPLSSLDAAPAAVKSIENGNLIIRHADHLYDSTGRCIR